MEYTIDDLTKAFNTVLKDVKALYVIRKSKTLFFTSEGRAWGRYYSKNVRDGLLPILLPYVNDYHSDEKCREDVVKQLIGELQTTKDNFYLKNTDDRLIAYVTFIFIPEWRFLGKYDVKTREILKIADKVKSIINDKSAVENEKESDVTDEYEQIKMELEELKEVNRNLMRQIDEMECENVVSPESVCMKIEKYQSKESVNELFRSANDLFARMNIRFSDDQLSRIEKKRAELEKVNFNISGNYIETQNNNYNK